MSRKGFCSALISPECFKKYLLLSLLATEVNRIDVITLLVLLTQTTGTDSDGAALDMVLSGAKLPGLQNLNVLIGTWLVVGLERGRREWRAGLGFIG